jgi:hypothetical protein
MWGRQPRAVRIAAIVLAGLLLLLVLAQVLLPAIAAGRIRSRVERYGSVDSVSVSAWPAVKLLWGDADSVHVTADSMTLSPRQAAALLWEGRGVSHLNLHASALRVGSLALTDATLEKRGSQLAAQASATQAATEAALPEGFVVKLLGSRDGEVEVEATGGLFGLQASVDAVAQAEEGRLVAHPEGALLEGFQLKLFSEPHVYVEGVGASVFAGEPLRYRLSMRASLR